MIYLMFFVVVSGLITVGQGDVSSQLGSTWNVPQDEINAGQWVANQIDLVTRAKGFTSKNLFGAQTTTYNIYRAADGWNYYYAIAWYIGHGEWVDIWYWWPPHFERHWCITNDAGGWVYDTDIYLETADRHTRFVFLWSCEQGDEIGGMAYGRAHGMPFAWLHTSDLSSNGYENPDSGGYVFNGFVGPAPYLTWDGLDGKIDGGKYFSYWFYHHALMYNRKIIDALDYAASWTFSKPTFRDTALYNGYYLGSWPFGVWGRMVVYGDGNHRLVRG